MKQTFCFALARLSSRIGQFVLTQIENFSPLRLERTFSIYKSMARLMDRFVLLAAAVLWAGCSDGDKNADKSLEQEKVNTEQSLDVKTEDAEKARKSSQKTSLRDIEKSVKAYQRRMSGTIVLYGSDSTMAEDK